MKTTRENPFRVPDGYFEKFTDRLIEQLPKQEQPKRLHLWRYAAAAVVAGLVATGSLYFAHQHKAEQTAQADRTEYINDALDYALVDNAEIATYLTDNQ